MAMHREEVYFGSDEETLVGVRGLVKITIAYGMECHI